MVYGCIGKIVGAGASNQEVPYHYGGSHSFYKFLHDFWCATFGLEMNSTLKKVNLKSTVDAVEKLFIYDKVGRLNGHVLSLVNVENRTLDFHIHEDSDELFYVIEGGFHLETDEGLIRVDEGEFIIVPKGTRHRPVVKSLTKFLMIELEGTLNKENSGDSYEE